MRVDTKKQFANLSSRSLFELTVSKNTSDGRCNLVCNFLYGYKVCWGSNEGDMSRDCKRQITGKQD